MNQRLMINASAESEGVAQPKGWMNSKFFLQWLQHFTKFVYPLKETLVLLLLDGHNRWHNETLDVINFCRNHNIYLISFLSHTTHKL